YGAHDRVPFGDRKPRTRDPRKSAQRDHAHDDRCDREQPDRHRLAAGRTPGKRAYFGKRHCANLIIAPASAVQSWRDSSCRTGAAGASFGNLWGEVTMKTIATILLATCAFTGIALAAGEMPGMTMADQPSAMGGMNMKMTLPPMPAVYAGVPDRTGAPLFEGYGNHTHKITTNNAKTHAYFDQGVRLLFGFNHAEAIRSFREGSRLD